jgi:hypothetical protein
MNGQRTRESPGQICVQGTVDAPIGSHNYRATLTLVFIQDHLEMALLMWTFDVPMSRREAGGALDSELRANYADELRKGSREAPLDFKKQFLGPLLNSRLEETPVYLTPWIDAQGNAVIIVDAWGQQSLLLIHASAKGIGTAPSPSPPAKY